MRPRLVTLVSILAALNGLALAQVPFHRAELIFPLERWHNHGSSIVECPNGDLIVCWFHGSGERTADDVVILGARKRKGEERWSEPFLMADTPEFPDTNCCMIIDPQGRLWLLWPTILANTWESALMKYKVSSNYMKPAGAPDWDFMEVLHMKPAEDFAAKVRAKTEAYLQGKDISDRSRAWAERNFRMAESKLDSRLGWFTRAHPYILEGRRLIVGLYSDGFSFSIVSFTDDWGQSWKMSDPIVGGGNIQPSFARRNDGTLVAYMRDNGPAPKRVHVSESTDEGQTWSLVQDHPQLANPGSGLELARLRNGRFIVAYNDTEQGRHSLAISISDDEGRTFRWTRHPERVEPGQGSFHYPSIIEAADGRLHVSYSYFVRDEEGREGKSIKHAEFDEAWVLAGDAP